MIIEGTSVPSRMVKSTTSAKNIFNNFVNCPRFPMKNSKNYYPFLSGYLRYY